MYGTKVPYVTKLYSRNDLPQLSRLSDGTVYFYTLASISNLELSRRIVQVSYLTINCGTEVIPPINAPLILRTVMIEQRTLA